MISLAYTSGADGIGNAVQYKSLDLPTIYPRKQIPVGVFLILRRFEHLVGVITGAQIIGLNEIYMTDRFYPHALVIITLAAEIIVIDRIILSSECIPTENSLTLIATKREGTEILVYEMPTLCGIQNLNTVLFSNLGQKGQQFDREILEITAIKFVLDFIPGNN